MVKFRKLIIWLCKKFNRDELLELIHEINLIRLFRFLSTSGAL